MAVLPILTLPDPVLRQRCKKVRSVDSTILRLAYDMVDTMRDALGIGLAANQVGVLKRIIVIQTPEEDAASIYINPVIINREGQRLVEEGCLSIPGYRGVITRSVTIRFEAMDHTSKLIKLRAEEILSQALEHEVDHLNGILYSDHLKDHEQLIPISLDDNVHEKSPASLTGTEALEEPNVNTSHQDQPEHPASLKIK